MVIMDYCHGIMIKARYIMNDDVVFCLMLWCSRFESREIDDLLLRFLVLAIMNRNDFVGTNSMS